MFATARYLARLNGYRQRVIPRVLSRVESGKRPVSIRELATPLRYDVVIRRQFYGLLKKNEELLRNDENAFVELAKNTDYYLWFKEMWWQIVYPKWKATPQMVEQLFRERVRSSATLFFSIRKNGWNPKHPILLRSGSEILPTRSGIELRRDFYAGDGCHRLAILWEQGQEILPAEYYRVRIYKRYSPRDNTHILRASGILTERQYVQYLALYYLGHTCRDRAELLAGIKRNNPERLHEVCQVLKTERRFLLPNGGR